MLRGQTKDHEVAAAAMVAAGRVGEKLAELMARLGAHFAGVEPFRQAGKYVRGLLSDLLRKNCWTLAEYAGDATPDRMQRLLERASWDTRAAMGTVRDFVAEHLACVDGGPAVLVLDESGDEATCGVKRQYVGCAGKVANAVNVVSATYSTLRSGTVLRADATLKILTPVSWQVASCKPGSKGERRYAWAWLGTASPRHFLLIRRSLAKPIEVAYFSC